MSANDPLRTHGRSDIPWRCSSTRRCSHLRSSADPAAIKEVGGPTAWWVQQNCPLLKSSPVRRFTSREALMAGVATASPTSYDLVIRWQSRTPTSTLEHSKLKSAQKMPFACDLKSLLDSGASCGDCGLSDSGEYWTMKFVHWAASGAGRMTSARLALPSSMRVLPRQRKTCPLPCLNSLGRIAATPEQQRWRGRQSEKRLGYCQRAER
jgi:hypothetical protein